MGNCCVLCVVNLGLTVRMEDPPGPGVPAGNRHYFFFFVAFGVSFFSVGFAAGDQWFRSCAVLWQSLHFWNLAIMPAGCGAP